MARPNSGNATRPATPALPLPVAPAAVKPDARPATCGDCRHWFAVGPGRFGECRRHPPAFPVGANDFGPRVAYGQTAPATPGCGDGEVK